MESCHPKIFEDPADYAFGLKKMSVRNKLPTEIITTCYFRKMELLRKCQIYEIIDDVLNVTIQNDARAGHYVMAKTFYEKYLFVLSNKVEVDEKST